MPRSIFIDAGPLVAYLRADDEHNVWARLQFEDFPGFVTCDAVLAEACARLAYHGEPQSEVLRLVNKGIITPAFSLAGRTSRVQSLMEKYADRQMDLADACLVAMTEETRDCLVITTDTRDFRVYRRFGREVIPFRSPRHA